MAYRKFFFGDTVIVKDPGYRTHAGHAGRIMGTLYGAAHHIYYRVACECGKTISPLASSMDLVSTPHDDHTQQSVREMRMAKFLRRVGVEPQPDSLKQQVKASLSTCKKMRDRQVMALRFGLAGPDGKTLQEIGDAYGITRARVQQIEARVLRTIRRAMEKEKHENRIGTTAGQEFEPKQTPIFSEPS